MNNILVTGSGGGGGNNMIQCLKNKLDGKYKIYGSNCLKSCVQMSIADETFLLPESSDAGYSEKLIELVETKNIDILIPCNDREVAKISGISELKEKIFLPDQSLVSKVQDKAKLFQLASRSSLPVPKSISIFHKDDIETGMEKIMNSSGKFWVRPRRGSGSKGATWVNEKDQAIKWIDLWCELRGLNVSDFQLCEFLPGRDLNIQSIWDSGKFITGTMVERKAYFGGEARLSGMASTPSIAERIHEEKLETQIENLSNSFKIPLHGSINIDLKQHPDGDFRMTEINIGRFPMIIRLHEAFINNSMSSLELYLNKIVDQSPLSNLGWIKEGLGTKMYRELDNLPTLIN